MLEIVLLIVGIFKAFQRPKLKRLKAENFPTVDPQKFTTWHDAQIAATDVFLGVTWGALFIKLLLLLTLSGTRYSAETGIGITVAILVLWVIGLLIAAGFSSKAKKLRNEVGIVCPAAGPQTQAQSMQTRQLTTTPPVASRTKMLRLLFILIGIVLLFIIGLLLKG